MKGHGVIRRVDNLGRIVLPIHFRKFLNIFENDDVLITLDQDQIIISKNDTFHGKTQTFKSICVSLYTIVGGTILICDHEKIVASYGIKSNLYLEGLYLSEDLKKRIKKDSFLSSNLSLIESFIETNTTYVHPIIGRNGKEVGSIIYIYEKDLLENVSQLISSYAIFISEILK